MQGKLSLAVGFVAGYVLGSKAGRQRYEEIVAQARKLAGSQTVQSTAGVRQAQASQLVNNAKDSGGVAKARQAVGRTSSPGTSGPSYVTETTPGAASGSLYEPSSTTNPPRTNGINP